MNISIEKCESRYKMSLKKLFVSSFHFFSIISLTHVFCMLSFFLSLMRYEWKYDNLLSLAQGEITVNKIFRMSTSQRARKQLVDLERYRSIRWQGWSGSWPFCYLFSHFLYEDKAESSEIYSLVQTCPQAIYMHALWKVFVNGTVYHLPSLLSQKTLKKKSNFLASAE